MLTRRTLLAASAVSFFLPTPLLAQSPAADAAILTGLDNSGSQYHSGRIVPMLNSLAKVLAMPELLGMLTCGPQGCTLFGIYHWSDRAQWLAPPVLLTRQNPHGAMNAIITALQAFTAQARYSFPGNPFGHNGGTNVEAALAFGFGYLEELGPSVAKVHNMVTDDDESRNGDNSRLLALKARAERLAITSNGLVLGKTNFADHYMHRLVQAGPRSWVKNAEQPGNMEGCWLDKFRADVAGLPNFNAG